MACYAFLSILCTFLCIPCIAATPGVQGSSSTINRSLASASSYHLPQIISPEAEDILESSTLAVGLSAESLPESLTLAGTEEF